MHKNKSARKSREIMVWPAPFATSYMIGREDKRTNKLNNVPNPKNNAAAGYKGPVRIEPLKGAGLLDFTRNKRGGKEEEGGGEGGGHNQAFQFSLSEFVNGILIQWITIEIKAM